MLSHVLLVFRTLTSIKDHIKESVGRGGRSYSQLPTDDLIDDDDSTLGLELGLGGMGGLKSPTTTQYSNDRIV